MENIQGDGRVPIAVYHKQIKPNERISMNPALQTELNTLIRRLDGLSPAAKRDRDRILTEAAGPLRSAIAGRAPQSDKPHNRYSTPKISGKLRAPKGRGVIAATYQPGNLRKSINTLRFRRSKAVFIGPKVDKRGSGRGADGYYAHMVNFGTIHQAPQHFVEAGVNAAGNIAVRIASELLRQKILSYAGANGLK